MLNKAARGNDEIFQRKWKDFSTKKWISEDETIIMINGKDVERNICNNLVYNIKMVCQNAFSETWINFVLLFRCSRVTFVV